MNKLKVASLLFLAFIFNQKLFAYPQFVGHGYNTCLTCHYNPFGNGPLNDYGRAISATAISGRSIYSDSYSEENIAANSGFLGSLAKSSWLKPSIDYRGLQYFRGIGTDESEKEFIQMQIDGNIVLKTSDNKLLASGTVGYAPVPRALKNTNQDVKKYRSREHYIGYRPDPKWGIYAGLMDKIYGLRIAEHSSFARSINNLSQNDQSYGLQFHYNHDKFEVGAGYFTGQFNQDESLRQKGFSVKMDYKRSSNSALGFSVLKSKNEFVEQFSFAGHFIGAIGLGSSILLEVGKATFTPTFSGGSEDDNLYLLGQTYLKIMRGLYLFNQIEILEKKEGATNMRFGPGLQYFPMQRLEFRTELYNTRNFSKKVSNNDTWDLLVQAHLWL